MARRLDGWPLIVLLHGMIPQSINIRLDTTLCDGPLPAGEPLWLYKRWRSTQRALSLAGYVTVALNMDWRDSPVRNGDPVAISAVRWLRTTEPWSSLLSQERLGVVGHSKGASEALAVTDEFDGDAIAVIGPTTYRSAAHRFGHRVGIGHLPPNNLTIGGRRDNNEGVVEAYRAARGPRTLVMFGSDEHYPYFDGLCGSTLSNDQAEEIRSVTRRALRLFFDRTVLSADVPGDLGIVENETVAAVHYSDVDGPTDHDPDNPYD